MSASNPPPSTLASFFRQREAWLVPALCGGALVVAGLSLYALFRVERKASREGGADLLDSDPPGPGSATAPRTGGASASGGGASDLTPHERALEQDFVCREKIDVDFADVGGLEAQIQEIEDLVLLPLSHPHLFAHSRIAQRPTGMLLYGPPGTGKTLLAKAIARRANANFFTVNVANVESKWFGETPKIVDAMFSLARKRAPCVIFIDEVDGLLSTRTEGEMSHVTTMKTTFMEKWDGLNTPSSTAAAAAPESAGGGAAAPGAGAAAPAPPAPSSDWVIVIGATNKPWALDPAVLRRMPRQVYVGLPDAESRAAILRVMLRSERVAADVDVGALAAATEGYSGSDLKEVIRAASLIPIREAFRREGRRAGGGGAHAATAAPAAPVPAAPREMATADFLVALESVRPTGAAARSYKTAQMRSAAPNAFAVGGGAAAAEAAPPLAKTPAVGGAPPPPASRGVAPATPGAAEGGADIARAILEFGPSSKQNSVSISSAVESASKLDAASKRNAAAAAPLRTIAGGQNGIVGAGGI